MFILELTWVVYFVGIAYGTDSDWTDDGIQEQSFSHDNPDGVFGDVQSAT